MKPEFFYFDMGNVLLRFSHERMAEQMGKVSGIDAKRAWAILFDEGLEWAYEHGELTREQFYARFCEAAGTKLADIEALDAAGNDIFELNPPMIGLVGRLAGARYRVGVCSNTTASHWAHCTRQFKALDGVFPVHALSFRLKAMKPEAKFYVDATKLAGVPAGKIFFTDDRVENVEAAAKAGWDAVLFESVSQVNEAIRQREIVVNY